MIICYTMCSISHLQAMPSLMRGEIVVLVKYNRCIFRRWIQFKIMWLLLLKLAVLTSLLVSLTGRPRRESYKIKSVRCYTISFRWFNAQMDLNQRRHVRATSVNSTHIWPIFHLCPCFDVFVQVNNWNVFIQQCNASKMHTYSAFVLSTKWNEWEKMVQNAKRIYIFHLIIRNGYSFVRLCANAYMKTCVSLWLAV